MQERPIAWDIKAHDGTSNTSKVGKGTHRKDRSRVLESHFIIRHSNFLWCLLILLLTIGCSYPTTTVLIVRHAEKEVGTDPPLTPAGEQRAQELIHVVEQAHVQAIYSTQFLRTKQTAQPLANYLSLTTTVVPVTGDIEQHAQDLVANIMDHYKGKSVLVVGHSNTVPRIIEELGITSPPQIRESEFKRLFVVIKKKRSSIKLIKATYGR